MGCRYEMLWISYGWVRIKPCLLSVLCSAGVMPTRNQPEYMILGTILENNSLVLNRDMKNRNVLKIWQKFFKIFICLA